MNINKRLAYLRNNDTQVGIHTGNGVTQSGVDLEKASKNNVVVDCNIRKVRNENKTETYMRVNPNRNNNGYILTEYTTFKEVMQEDNVLTFGMKEIKSFEIVCCQELDEIKAPEKQVPLSVGEIRKNKSIKKEGGRCLW